MIVRYLETDVRFSVSEPHSARRTPVRCRGSFQPSCSLPALPGMAASGMLARMFAGCFSTESMRSHSVTQHRTFNCTILSSALPAFQGIIGIKGLSEMGLVRSMQASGVIHACLSGGHCAAVYHMRQCIICACSKRISTGCSLRSYMIYIRCIYIMSRCQWLGLCSARVAGNGQLQWLQEEQLLATMLLALIQPALHGMKTRWFTRLTHFHMVGG